MNLTPDMNTIIDLKILQSKVQQLALCFVLIVAGSTTVLNAQSKGPLQLADQYFAAGEYFTAAGLYEQFLHPVKKTKSPSDFPLISRRHRGGGNTTNQSPAAVLYKQAESYRLAHYWKEAQTSYQESYSKNKTESIDALYWVAICQRSLGNLPSAKESLNTYLQTGSTFKTEALAELNRIKFIQQETSRPDTLLYKIASISSEIGSGLYAAVKLSPTQYLVTTTEPDSTKTIGVNPYHSRVYTATLNGTRFENLQEISIPVSDALSNHGAASISPDGNRIYFTQWKLEATGKTASIYSAQKQANGWSKPILVPLVNVTGSSNKQPFCSADGKSLYFSSNRSGGSGKFDIWYANFNADGSVKEVLNAGKTINTDADEEAPYVHNSTSTLVFSSNGSEGLGGFDLFQSMSTGNTWSQPENLGYPINSVRDDIYFSSRENTDLFQHAIFSSDRGNGCCLETYLVNKKKKVNVLSGIVTDCAGTSAMANTTITFTDAMGQELKTATDSAGKYTINFGTEPVSQYFVKLSKQGYVDTSLSFKYAEVNSADPLTTQLNGAPLCLAKTPVFTIKAEDVVTVFFDFDKSNLKPDAIVKLDSIYDMLTANPIATIQISGYTDGRGTAAYNAVLSDKRARACADYIAAKGIDPARISFVSFGACCPIEMELINGRDNAEGRSKNRRALINVKKD
jgi:OmpA-OmpF porin, OOP family